MTSNHSVSDRYKQLFNLEKKRGRKSVFMKHEVKLNQPRRKSNIIKAPLFPISELPLIFDNPEELKS